PHRQSPRRTRTREMKIPKYSVFSLQCSDPTGGQRFRAQRSEMLLTTDHELLTKPRFNDSTLPRSHAFATPHSVRAAGASPSPWGEGRGEGELPSSHPCNNVTI